MLFFSTFKIPMLKIVCLFVVLNDRGLEDASRDRRYDSVCALQFFRLPGDLATACYDMSTRIAFTCKALVADIFFDLQVASEPFCAAEIATLSLK